MKLETLLKEITPLPWNDKTPFPNQGKELWNNHAYRRHAANILPDLVADLKRLRDVVGDVDMQIIDEILERAENVKEL